MTEVLLDKTLEQRGRGFADMKEISSATSEVRSEWIRETLGVVDKNPVKAGSLRNNRFCHRRGMKLRLSFHSPSDHLLSPASRIVLRLSQTFDKQFPAIALIMTNSVTPNNGVL